MHADIILSYGFVNLLYCRTNAAPIPGAAFSVGSGPILLDDVDCLGFENNLAQCRNKGWYNNDCRHSEDVGVICYSGNYCKTAKI